MLQRSENKEQDCSLKFGNPLWCTKIYD